MPVLGVYDSEELIVQEVQDAAVSDEAIGPDFEQPLAGKEEGSEVSLPPGEDETSIDQIFKGSNLLMNSLLILLLLIFIFLFIGLIVVCNKYIMPRCCGCMKSLCSYIGNKLMFNSVIRGLLESYFPLGIATFYQLS